jgi:pimeloyl-ACP methyl ester carboxylesterase
MRGLVALGLLAVISSASGTTEPRDIAFVSTADGTTQHYLLLLPEGYQGTENPPLMVALHSLGGTRAQFLETRHPTVRAAVDTVAKWRMIYVLPEYRGPRSWMGEKAEADVVQIIAQVKSRYRTGKVFLCGTSMGGSAALTFTALHPGLVDGVIAMNATANHLELDTVNDSVAESFGGSKERIPLEYKKRSAEYWPERFTMPVALTAGGKDSLIPPASVTRLAGVLGKLGRKVLLIVPPDQGHQTSYEDALAAFDFVVRAAGLNQ